MKLLKVTLKDFGLYRGINEFDLAPRIKYRQERPVILFGGKNGAGKTTLLEAVKLGFYGKNSLGNKVTQQNYNKYLKSKIHISRGALVNPQDAKIEIEFDLVTGGEKATYSIARSWQKNNGHDPHETLRLKKNGDLVTDVDPQFQQEFISGIVPDNLSQLFFFDGEKIQAIADDITSNAAISDSIKTLLGLDIVERLQADLSIYSQRELKEVANKKDQTSLEEHEAHQKVIEKELEKLTDELAGLDTQLSGVTNEIERRHKRLSEEGASFADLLSGEQTKQAGLEADIERIEKQIRAECESFFPLALCPKTSGELVETLESEATNASARVLHEELSAMGKALVGDIDKSKTLKGEEKQTIKGLVDKRIGQKLKKLKSAAETQPFLDCNGSEKQKILGWLDSATTHSAQSIKTLCTELERATRDLQECRRKQAQVPDEDILKPIFEEMQEFSREQGALESHRKQKEEGIAQKKEELKEIQRDIEKITQKNEYYEKKKAQLDLAHKSQEVLKEYSARLTQIKIDGLCASIAESFNHLIRKDDFVNNVEVDPKTFEVTLFDQKNQKIQRDDLSSGEKQLFAISVLWALAKSSGRPLPVIIDTPLGRLDSDHRLNLVRNYLPHAAHQVIVLSTDTEVDRDLFKEISPNVSHCYHLQYNQEETRTAPKEEYFWKLNGHG
tara:strand:- start:14998 stop:17019 length:2022 start_codon:yes stop_codon:yes gene_type:complete